jgi:hypothetical protein
MGSSWVTLIKSWGTLYPTNGLRAYCPLLRTQDTHVHCPVQCPFLRTVYSPQGTVYCPLFKSGSVQGTLPTPHDTLQLSGHNVNSSGYTAHSSGHTLQLSGYNVNSSGYTTHSSGFTLQLSGYNVNSSGYTTHSSGHTLQLSGYNVNSSGYTVQSLGHTAQPLGTILTHQGTLFTSQETQHNWPQETKPPTPK